ncbi:hypothetical protein FKB34_02200 [Glycocaulis profundi]|nr:hypothetical protein FKB34_02200 [Glycocaulis profundi]
MKINLDTKIADFDRPIFSLFPGVGYEFFDLMHEESIVFLDFPRLKPRKTLEEMKSNEFKAQLVRSISIANWHKESESNRGELVTDIDQYLDAKWGPRRSRYAAAIHTLFNVLQTGDLIVVPSKEHFGDVLVGEITSTPQVDGIYRGEGYYKGQSVCYRKVRWIGRRPQYKISESLLRSLKTPGPLVQISKNHFREVFDIAFDSIAYHDEFQSKVFLSGLDSKGQLNLSLIVNLISATSRAVDEGVAIDQNETIFNLIYGHVDEEYLPCVSASINSPGFVRYASKKIIPLVLLAVMAVASAACDSAGGIPAELPDPQSIDVTLRGEADHPCVIRVRDATREAMGMMGINRWQQFCEMLLSLEEHSNLQVPASVQNVDGELEQALRVLEEENDQPALKSAADQAILYNGGTE